MWICYSLSWSQLLCTSQNALCDSYVIFIQHGWQSQTNYYVFHLTFGWRNSNLFQYWKKNSSWWIYLDGMSCYSSKWHCIIIIIWTVWFSPYAWTSEYNCIRGDSTVLVFCVIAILMFWHLMITITYSVWLK